MKKLTIKERLLQRSDSSTIECFNHVFISYGLITALFKGRSGKPKHHYSFKTEEQQKGWIETQITLLTADEKQALIREEELMKKRALIKEGDIFYSSWGYDQTNVDYYVVLEINNSIFTLQQLGKENFYTQSSMSGVCAPDINNKIGEPFKKRLSKYNTFTMTSYSNAFLWDGKKKEFSSWA